MMLDARTTEPSKRKMIALWRLQLQHHYRPLRRWTAIIVPFLFLGHSHHWVTTTLALISKGRHPGLSILQPTPQFHPQNTTDQRKEEIRGVPFNLSRYPPTYQRLPSTAGRPLRTFTHPESTKTGKSRFPFPLTGSPFHRGMCCLGPAERKRKRKRKKRLQNNRPLVLTERRNRSQKCSGDSVDPMVCLPSHYF